MAAPKRYARLGYKFISKLSGSNNYLSFSIIFANNEHADPINLASFSLS